MENVLKMLAGDSWESCVSEVRTQAHNLIHAQKYAIWVMTYWALVWFCVGYSRYFSRHVQEHRDDGRVVIAVDDESHLYEPLSEVFYVSCKLLYSLQTWKETGMTRFNPSKEEGSKGQVDTNIFCRFASQPGRAGNRMIRYKYCVMPGRQNGKSLLRDASKSQDQWNRYLLCI